MTAVTPFATTTGQAADIKPYASHKLLPIRNTLTMVSESPFTYRVRKVCQI